MATGLLALTGIAGLAVPPHAALAALDEPAFALSLAAIWGAVGGSIGRRLGYRHRRFARS